MVEKYNAQGLTHNITDLAQACVTNSQAEVIKDFVAAAFLRGSYILSTAVGGKTKDKKEGLQQSQEEPLFGIQKRLTRISTYLRLPTIT